MKTLEFATVEDFCDYFAKQDYDSFNSVICKYDLACFIIEEMVSKHCEPLHDITLDSPDFTGYEDEFIVSISEDGIDCEPMVRDGKYIDTEGDYVFVTSECSSKVLKHVEAIEDMYEVYIEELEEDCCCGNCDCCENSNTEPSLGLVKDKDGNIHGYQYSDSGDGWYISHSYYADDIMTHEDVCEMLDLFNGLKR